MVSLKWSIVSCSIVLGLIIQLVSTKAVLKSAESKQDDKKDCQQEKVDWAFKNEDQANGTGWFPEVDPTVLLGIVDAIRNGDLFNEIMAGFRRIFTGINMGRSWFQNSNITNATVNEALKTLNQTFFI